jgi:hypothetical protein
VVVGSVGASEQRRHRFSARGVELAQRHHVHGGQRNPVL